MQPISVNGKQIFNREQLETYIKKTCLSHRNRGRALAFAFIVCDFDNHAVQKILRDKYYWSALDRISGDKICVCYMNSIDHYYNARQEEIREEEKLFHDLICEEETARSLFAPITIKPTPSNSVDEIRHSFDIPLELKPPFIVFFQLDRNGYLLDSFFIRLREERDIEIAFWELRKYIKCAADAIDAVHPANFNNYREIYNLIKSDVERMRFGITLHKLPLNIGVLFRIARLFSPNMS
ncbi:MAG: hypothetical protein LBN06_12960 [Prevotellaceae bacterium]|jgi:hypothetical protein|nr:hypothetical protein [Prevotellaceae bacterium]